MDHCHSVSWAASYALGAIPLSHKVENALHHSIIKWMQSVWMKLQQVLKALVCSMWKYVPYSYHTAFSLSAHLCGLRCGIWFPTPISGSSSTLYDFPTCGFWWLILEARAPYRGLQLPKLLFIIAEVVSGFTFFPNQWGKFCINKLSFLLNIKPAFNWIKFSEWFPYKSKRSMKNLAMAAHVTDSKELKEVRAWPRATRYHSYLPAHLPEDILQGEFPRGPQPNTALKPSPKSSPVAMASSGSTSQHNTEPPQVFCLESKPASRTYSKENSQLMLYYKKLQTLPKSKKNTMNTPIPISYIQ